MRTSPAASEWQPAEGLIRWWLIGKAHRTASSLALPKRIPTPQALTGRQQALASCAVAAGELEKAPPKAPMNSIFCCVARRMTCKTTRRCKPRRRVSADCEQGFLCKSKLSRAIQCCCC